MVFLRDIWRSQVDIKTQQQGSIPWQETFGKSIYQKLIIDSSIYNCQYGDCEIINAISLDRIIVRRIDLQKSGVSLFVNKAYIAHLRNSQRTGPFGGALFGNQQMYIPLIRRTSHVDNAELGLNTECRDFIRDT